LCRYTPGHYGCTYKEAVNYTPSAKVGAVHKLNAVYPLPSLGQFS
jgi:hypothetical protein